MEISQVITGMLLFAMAMFISDLYNEVRKLKARLEGKSTMPKYDNAPPPPLNGRAPTLKGLLERKDEEIKSLKAELNKVKFDYACEVAGKK